MRGLLVYLFMRIDQILEEIDHNDVLGVELLLAHVLGVERAYLLAHPEHLLNTDTEQCFRSLYTRLRKGEPVAHLIGTKEFFGLEFQVNRSVLIPRPETEILVEEVIKFADKESGLRVLDVGTGSGAIAIALAKHLPNATVVATDVSHDAIEVARTNAEKHGVDVAFHVSDLLEEVKGSFDVIVANLPYIGEEKFRFVSKETEQYEPSVALFGGVDGLELYRRLFRQLTVLDWRPRLLLGEFGFAQADSMREALNNFFEQEDWRIKKDYASIDRVFMVRFSSL